MTDLLDKNIRPELDEICEYVKNPLFARFCSEIKETYHCAETMEYSSCSWEKGWNVKFKKSGKTLCTLYPREGFFTVLVVVGKKEKPAVEEILPECTAELRLLYDHTHVFVNEKVEQKGSKKLSTISTKEYKDTGQPEFFRRAQMHKIWSPFSAM